MKRFLPFFVAVLVALIAAQPLLADGVCGFGASAGHACLPGCQMASMADMGSAMGPDCPMPASMTGSGCGQSCCPRDLPQFAAQFGHGFKPRAIGKVFVAIVPAPLPAINRLIVSSPPSLMIGDGPPRHILLQVFRV